MKWPCILSLLLLTACHQASTHDKSDRAVVAEMSVDPSTEEKKYMSTNIAEKKAYFEQTFLQMRDTASYEEETIWGSLHIGNLFGEEHRAAVLRTMVNDSTANVVVLQQTGNKWDTILFRSYPEMEVVAWEDYIDIKDFNGDDIPDLFIATGCSYIMHTASWGELWLSVNGRFRKVEGFEDVVNPTYYKQDDKIYAYQSRGCADMNMYFGVFRISNYKVQHITAVSCDCCSEDSCIIKADERKAITVPIQKACEYVPAYYADVVKEKCDWVIEHRQ